MHYTNSYWRWGEYLKLCPRNWNIPRGWKPREYSQLRKHINLHNKRRYVCLFVCLCVCMLPMAGRTAGPIKTKLGIGTHVDPRSVLVKVKVKVIYLCVPYNRIHECDSWRTTVNHATWWMLIKLLIEAGKGRENSSAKRDKYGGQMSAGPRQYFAPSSVRRTGTYS